MLCFFFVLRFYIHRSLGNNTAPRTKKTRHYKQYRYIHIGLVVVYSSAPPRPYQRVASVYIQRNKVFLEHNERRARRV